jgi:hypothetical protein
MKDITQEVPEQRYIVMFLFKDVNKPLNITQRSENVYGGKALKKTQVYIGIAEVRRGCEDFSDGKRPGRPPGIGLDEVLVHRYEADPYTTAGKIAHSLGMSPQTVINHLGDCLGMKCFQL